MTFKKMNKKFYTSITTSLILLLLTQINVQAADSESNNLPEETQEIIESEMNEDVETIEEEIEIEEDRHIEESEEITEENLEEETIEEPEETPVTEESDEEDEVEGTLEEPEVNREAAMTAFSARTRSQPHYTTSFINAISPYAMDIGEEHGLYPSIIIAQAALESGWGGKSPAIPDDYVLALPPNYNLFGVKGDYNGESVPVNTKEYIKEEDEYIDVVDYFRKYPSYYESLLDYATKMRYNTTTTDPYFYSGVWVENTDSYKDATAFLSGRYATDPLYHEKLNRIINQYNLEQYDEEVYQTIETPGQEEKPEEESQEPGEEPTDENTSQEPYDEQTVAYQAVIDKDVSIFTQPGSGEVIDISNNVTSNHVIVREEAMVGSDTWVKVEASGISNGWIKKNELTPTYDVIHSENTVAYEAQLKESRYELFSRPAYTEGNKQTADARDFFGSPAIVRAETETDRATWVLLEVNGQEVGWMNKKGITANYDKINSENTVAYAGEMKESRYEVFSRPAYTAGNTQTATTENYFGQPAIIRAEAETKRATWVLLEVGGQEIGWMNKKGITPKYDEIHSENTVAYSASINNSRFELFSRPAYTADNKQTTKAENYFGESAIVRAEAVTDRATWVLLEVDGQEVGWMNKRGITANYDQINSENTVAYAANLKSSRFELFSRPAYTEGNKQVANAEDYFSKPAIVRAEAVTDRATWVLLEVDGQEIGWMNKKGINPNYDRVLSERNTSYSAKLKNSRYEFFSRPAYTDGNIQTATAQNYFGQTVRVRGEAITNRATWVLLEISGQYVGWINQNAITTN